MSSLLDHLWLVPKQLSCWCRKMCQTDHSIFLMIFCFIYLVILCNIGYLSSLIQFSSVSQSCPTLCNPMNRAACQAFLSITNSQNPPKPMSVESVMPSNHLILSSPSPPALNLSQYQGLFKWLSSLLRSVSGGQSIGVSASTSALPMNTQNWSPLGWTGWIFLQSKGLSKVLTP